MPKSQWASEPRSNFWPQVGEILPFLVGPAFVTRPSIGVAAMQLATNFAQSALSLTPIDPRITCWCSPAAWPAFSAGRTAVRRVLSPFKEFGKMTRLSRLAAICAAAGKLSVLYNSVWAHPGVEGSLEREVNARDVCGRN